MHTPSFSVMARSSTPSTRTSKAPRPTYGDIVMLSAAYARADRAAHMPLLGLLSGLALAIVLWSVIGWLLWAVWT